MNWESLKAFIKKVADHPLTISIVVILLCFGVALILFSKTSIGKKSLNILADLHRQDNETAQKTLKKVEDVETLAKNRIDELKDFYEQKIALLVSLFDFYIQCLFEIAALIPNSKVQARVKELETTYEEKIKEISNVVGEIYRDYTLAVEEKEKAIRTEYKGKIEFLEHSIEELRLFIKEVKEEKENGEGEETINNNPTTEEIQEN